MHCEHRNNGETNLGNVLLRSELAEAKLEDILSTLIRGDGDRWGNWTLEDWVEQGVWSLQRRRLRRQN